MKRPTRPFARLTSATALLALVAGVVSFAATSGAEVSAVRGLSFGYYTNVSLFGGPAAIRGYGQAADAPETAASPSVVCPAGGGADTATDPDGARATYGPAAIFAGKWPADAPAAPPSGPITTEVDCQLGATGFVAASASIGLMPAGSPYPGGVGPGPFVADEVTSTCRADADGTVTGSTTVVNGILETRYDPVTQEPVETEAVPAEPAPNYERTGTIDHVGDNYRIVFNEQITNPDGSLTVNAAHLYLLGPIAVGDMVIASTTCGVTVSDTTTTTDPGPTTTIPGTTTTIPGTSTTIPGTSTTVPGTSTTEPGTSTTVPGTSTTVPGTSTTTVPGTSTTVPGTSTTVPGTSTTTVPGTSTTVPPDSGATCAGLKATIVGTDEDDHLVGTHEADVIVGLGGDDHIVGLGGDDVICGGDGDDHVVGGAGDDRIDGGAGRDHLIGNHGRDRLDGGADADRCNGPPDDDRLVSCERSSGGGAG